MPTHDELPIRGFPLSAVVDATIVTLVRVNVRMNHCNHRFI